MSYIQVCDLTKQYGSGASAVTAVRGMGFEVAQGEFIAIMGESGSGKSTLLSMLGGLTLPTSGRYTAADIDVYALKADRRADFRREFLGFVFQSFHLIRYLTVVENVMLPLTTTRFSRGEKRQMAERALERVRLADKLRRLPGEISGGEQERVAIARAIVNAPPILLADEPTGNLDSKTSHAVMELLLDLNGDGMTIVMVTHSHESAGYSDRILQIADGRLAGEQRPVVAAVEV